MKPILAVRCAHCTVLLSQARWTIAQCTQLHRADVTHAGEQPSSRNGRSTKAKTSLSLSLSLRPVLANSPSHPLPSQSSRCLPLWPSFCIWLCVLLRAMCGLPGVRLCLCDCPSVSSPRIMFFNAVGLSAVACVGLHRTAVLSCLNNTPEQGADYIAQALCVQSISVLNNTNSSL